MKLFSALPPPSLSLHLIFSPPYLPPTFNSAEMVEGTATTILEDSRGHVTGVAYKDKATGSRKVIVSSTTIFAATVYIPSSQALNSYSLPPPSLPLYIPSSELSSTTDAQGSPDYHRRRVLLAVSLGPLGRHGLHLLPLCGHHHARLPAVQRGVRGDRAGADWAHSGLPDIQQGNACAGRHPRQNALRPQGLHGDHYWPTAPQYVEHRFVTRLSQTTYCDKAAFCIN